MDDLERIKKHHGGPHLDGNPSSKPYWKRMHRSPFFWVAAFSILLAMVIFMATDYFSIWPRLK